MHLCKKRPAALLAQGKAFGSPRSGRRKGGDRKLEKSSPSPAREAKCRWCRGGAWRSIDPPTNLDGRDPIIRDRSARMKNLTKTSAKGVRCTSCRAIASESAFFGAASFNVSSLLRILVEVEFAGRSPYGIGCPVTRSSLTDRVFPLFRARGRASWLLGCLIWKGESDRWKASRHRTSRTRS